MKYLGNIGMQPINTSSKKQKKLTCISIHALTVQVIVHSLDLGHLSAPIK